MKILAALRDNAANYFRTQCPFLVLKYGGLEVDVRPLSLGIAAEYDILWLQMHAEPLAEMVRREFQDAGKRVVYDVDDWLFEMPPSWVGYDGIHWRGNVERGDRMILHERALYGSTLVTCTTPYLAEKLRTVTRRPIEVLPNCVMQGDWDILPAQKHDQDGPVLGWFGTGNHWEDWLEIAPAVDSALAEVNGYLALVGAPEMLTCFPERLRKRTLLTPAVPMKDFHKLRSLLKACDAGLAWTTDKLTASLCRSPLKALQWGAAGVPLVASATVYGDVLKESYYTPATLRSLAGRIVEALSQADFPRAQRVAHWQNQVWMYHSYETQSRRWLECITKLLKGGYDA